MGDINDDGFDDYLVGNDFLFARGEAILFSGLDGSELWCEEGSTNISSFGTRVAAAGDMNQDGRLDFLVATNNTFLSEPAVFVYSGLDYSVLFTTKHLRYDLPISASGLALDGLGDINGDGVLDFLEGASEKLPESTLFFSNRRIVSGTTGAILWKQWRDFDFDIIEEARIIGDLDGDGYSEWALAIVAAESVASYRIYRGGPGDAIPACPGEVNSTGLTGQLTAPFGLSTENYFRLLEDQVPAGETGLFFYGSPIPSVPFGEGNLCVGGEVFRMSTPLSSQEEGATWLDVDFSLPPMNGAWGNGALEFGSSWRFQYWYRDPSTPSGFNLTNALDIAFTSP